MAIVIRDADINVDRRLLIDTIYKNLTTRSDDRRFEWLYLNNPFGIAKAWIAFDQDEDIVIGIAAAFPRLVQVYGENIVCWNLGDFAISESFRSLGPAILLQRACLLPIAEGKIPFSYDHPSVGMTAVYERIGVPPTGKVIRFAKPIKIDNKIKRYVGEGILARGFSSIGNRILEFRDRSRTVVRGYDISLHQGRFGDEFSQLDLRVACSFKVSGRRTAEYLNWRYLDNPLYKYEVITVRYGEKLLAYAVFTQINQDAMLTDIFGEQNPEVVEILLVKIIEILRQRRILTLSIPLLEFNPLIPFVKRVGFYPRESSHVVFYTQQNGRLDGVITECKNWFLTYGDRDI